MAACSRSIFPSKVLKLVEQEAAGFSTDAPVPDTMKLSSSMKKSRLGDSTLVEIEIKKDDDKTVEEVDVLRGREILQRFSGKYGSICLVVRRPG
jgi:hypothetical protein